MAPHAEIPSNIFQVAPKVAKDSAYYVKASTADVARTAIREYFDKMDFKLPSYNRDVPLEESVYKAVKSWEGHEVALRYIPTAIALTTTAYAHIDNMDLKVLLALFIVLATTLDEPEILDALPSRDFHERLCTGLAFGDNSMLGEFVRIAAAMYKFYPQYPAASISTSIFQFINICILENTSQDMPLHPDSRAFVEYRRARTSFGECYAHFIWPKSRFPDSNAYVQALPDAITFIGYLNDILSFYKEELAGEVGNYINDRALVSKMTALETLREVIDEAAAMKQRIQRILGEGEVRDAWDAFVTGAIAFHVVDPRYRLQEILEDKSH
ncbi:terpene cyclase [Gelatoporia subvermispora B]|uniref:Terpene cyclase n=1 Tax=Ceriporiopsis subvermispora (strain B) TaxID=914234 RepID=M2RCV7_CERS8|nr:terpene cyclase [Gelatoporia subvermispora B]